MVQEWGIRKHEKPVSPRWELGSPFHFLHFVLPFWICVALPGPDVSCFQAPQFVFRLWQVLGAGVWCPCERSVTKFPHLAMAHPEASVVSALSEHPPVLGPDHRHCTTPRVPTALSATANGTVWAGGKASWWPACAAGGTRSHLGRYLSGPACLSRRRLSELLIFLRKNESRGLETNWVVWSPKSHVWLPATWSLALGSPLHPVSLTSWGATGA